MVMRGGNRDVQPTRSPLLLRSRRPGNDGVTEQIPYPFAEGGPDHDMERPQFAERGQ